MQIIEQYSPRGKHVVLFYRDQAEKEADTQDIDKIIGNHPAYEVAWSGPPHLVPGQFQHISFSRLVLEPKKYNYYVIYIPKNETN